jgi:hypothetical protein
MGERHDTEKRRSFERRIALLQAAVVLYIADPKMDRDDACAAARQFWFTLEKMDQDKASQ